MTALKLRKIYGRSLVGRKVEVIKYGFKIRASVTMLRPKPDMPEVVFNARHPTRGELEVLAFDQCSLA